jgi:argininosuccinate lyase
MTKEGAAERGAAVDPRRVSGRLWGGRFDRAPSSDLMALSRSEPAAFDLAPYDIAASAAYSRQLLDAGILDEGEQLSRRRAPERAG